MNREKVKFIIYVLGQFCRSVLGTVFKYKVMFSTYLKS